jgi:hypothetical protein
VCRNLGGCRPPRRVSFAGYPMGGSPVFLSTACGEVEPVVRADQQIAAARVARIRMEDAVITAEERTRSRLLAGPAHPVVAERGEVLEVVFGRRDGIVERDVEVVVEVATERRLPRKGPAHPRSEPLALRQRPTRDNRQRRVPSMQVREVTDVVDEERARRTTLGLLQLQLTLAGTRQVSLSTQAIAGFGRAV